MRSDFGSRVRQIASEIDCAGGPTWAPSVVRPARVRPVQNAERPGIRGRTRQQAGRCAAVPRFCGDICFTSTWWLSKKSGNGNAAQGWTGWQSGEVGQSEGTDKRKQIYPSAARGFIELSLR